MTICKRIWTPINYHISIPELKTNQNQYIRICQYIGEF